MAYAWNSEKKKDEEEQQIKYAWNAPLDRQYTVREGPTMLQPGSIVQTPINKTLTAAPKVETKKKKPNLFQSIVNGLNSGGYAADKALLSIPKIAASVVPNVADAILPKSVYNKKDDILLNKINSNENYLQNRSNTEIAKNANASTFNKVVGQGAKFVPQALEMAGEFAIPLGKVGTVGKALEKGAAPVTDLSLKLGSKLPARIAQAGIKSGTEFGLYGGLKTGLEGGSPKEMANNARDSAISGALFGAGGKTLGEVKNSAFPGWKTVLNESQPINNPNNVLKTPQKAVGEVNPLVSANTTKIKVIEKPSSISEGRDSTFFKTDSNLMDVSGHIPKNGDTPFIDNIWYKNELAKDSDPTIKENIPSELLGKGNAIKNVSSVIDYFKSKGIKKFDVNIMSDDSFNLMKSMEKKGYVKQLTEYKFDGDDVSYEILKPQEMSTLAASSLSPIKQVVKPKFEPNGSLKPKITNLNTDTLPIEKRNFTNVGDKKVNAYQYDHPELQPYIKQEANILKGELERGNKPESIWKTNSDGYNSVTRTDRESTQDIAALLDHHSYDSKKGGKYEQLSKAIDDVIQDHGKENHALAKRVELIIDDRLSKGYHDDITGSKIPPHEGYVEDKTFIQNMPNESNESRINKSKLNPKQPITPQKIINTDYSKINDEATLNSHIAELENNIKNPSLVMNLQQFANKLEEARTQLTTVKNRKFISNSVMNSEVAPQVMKNTIPKPTYVPINNQTTWKNALDRVDKDHEGSIKEFAKQRELKSADDTALGQALITKAIKENRIADANDLSIDLAEKLTKAGQTVQAASIFKRLTPEGMLQYANKTINKVNEVNVKNGKVGNVKLSESEATDIVERMKKINSMEDGRAKDVEMGKVFNVINGKVPSNIVDKVRTLRNISLLGNIKTNVRNVTGNALMGVTDNMANIVATPIDKLISIKTGQRTASIPSPSILFKGSKKGFNEAISDSFGGLSKADLAGKTAAEKRALLKEGFLNPINTDMTTNGKFETGKGLSFQNKPLRIAENAVGTALKVGDKTFSQAYYDDMLNQLTKSNKVDVATPEMKSIAENVAKERTYQDNNNVTKFLTGIKNSPQRLKGEKSKNITQVAMDTILPYVKTPANILKRGIEYTPVGIGEGLSKASKAIKTGDLAMQRQAVDRLGRGIVGTGLGTAGYALSKNGIATGAADKDKDIAALNKQVGKLPYSLKLPNGKNINYSWLQPTSMPFSAGVQMAQKGKGNVANNAWGAASNALNFYTEQPMLQSVQRILGNSNDSKSAGQRLLESQLQLPNQLVPTALKQVAQTMDDNTRSNYSPDFLKQALINPVKNKIPGVSESLPKVYDTLGREVKVSQGNNNIFNTAINPANVTKDKTSDVEKMIFDVYKNTSDATIFPRVAPKYITSGKERYDLSSKEYAAYQKEIGENTRSMLEGLLTNSNFMNNGADEKAKIIKSGIDKVNKAARDSYLSSKKKTN